MKIAAKKMRELNKKENITVKEMRDRKAAILKERKTKMDGLLTAELKNKIANLKAEQKLKKEEHYAKRMDKMKTHLNLTDDQVSKLKAQRSNIHIKAENIKNNESLSREQISGMATGSLLKWFCCYYNSSEEQR